MITTDEQLDRLRGVGDPLVDALVADHVARFGPESIRALVGQLFRNSGMPEEHALVAAVRRAVPAPAVEDWPEVERGQRLFELYGPEILLTLGSYSLPLAYAAGSGVQVIARARRLKDDPVRRLCDTAQMVVNVMQVGALKSGEIGERSAQKVRLMHSLIRYEVESDEREPWRAAWGKAINQEDLAGTLLTFSAAPLQALRRMGARLSDDDANAYIAAWSLVGQLLGVDASMLVSCENDARSLALRIGQRQLRATDEGRELTAQLLSAVETLFPLKGYALSLTHFFLEDTVFGGDVAAILGLPGANWTQWLVRARAVEKRAVLGLLNAVPGARKRRSFVARHVAQKMILLQRPEERGPFEVPVALRRRWGLPLSS